MFIIRIGLVLLFLTLSTISATAEVSIRLASGEWEPYQSKGLKYAGFASRIVTEAFAAFAHGQSHQNTKQIDPSCHDVLQEYRKAF